MESRDGNHTSQRPCRRRGGGKKEMTHTSQGLCRRRRARTAEVTITRCSGCAGAGGGRDKIEMTLALRSDCAGAGGREKRNGTHTSQRLRRRRGAREKEMTFTRRSGCAGAGGGEKKEMTHTHTHFAAAVPSRGSREKRDDTDTSQRLRRHRAQETNTR